MGQVDPECESQPVNTLCTDTDGNECTIAECDGNGTCDQSADFDTFSPCNTGFPGCSSGQCLGPNCTPNPGPCPDTDGNPCTEARCGSSGCDQTLPRSSGSTCPDTDDNECTIAECDGNGICDQSADFDNLTSCSTGFPGCSSGQCLGPNCEPFSAPCADTDGNPCTTARCGSSGCDQTLPRSSGDPCPDTDNNECTIAECDGNGTCDQSADFDTFSSCNTGFPGCSSGQCLGPNCTPNPGPCPDTDGNPCTTAGCGSSGCDQSAVIKPDNTSCNDLSACTNPDTCQSGICVGSNPVVCSALDQCHDVGICDPASGICPDPPLPDGSPCDDDDECTQPDSCQGGICIPGFQRCRVSVSKKGSLLYYSKIELRWNAAGTLIQDTFLTIINDYPDPVYVQWYFINGDAPTAAVFSGSPPILVERAHKGWNWVDCTTRLTEDESSYMSASSGLALGCQPLTILDPGTPKGRPDPDGAAGERVLRGYAVAFAVDNVGHEISWNHLSGSVDIVNYANRSAWEYNAFAFQCVADVAQGDACESQNDIDVVAGATAGNLKMDGLEYDYAFGQLLFDFYAVGSTAFSQVLPPPAVPVSVQLDTDLTLYPVSADLRQETEGPVVTKAKFDIWNENEDGLSGTYRCITCWDQTLLSNYDAPNNFLIGNLQTNKGKARIDGMQSDVCDSPDLCCHLGVDRACFPAIDHPTPDKECSQNAAILGVSDKILHFSGVGSTGRTDAGMTLVGQGQESATFQRDIIAPPEPLSTDDRGVDGMDVPNVKKVPVTPIRTPDQKQVRLRSDKE